MAGALATIGKVAQGVQTARTIKGAIGGSRQKGAIVKQKRPRLAQFSKGVEDAKSGAIIKRPTILPSLGSTPEARISSRPRTIKDKLDAIIAFIKERKNLKKNTRKGLRKTKEKSEREEKENLKENPAKKFIKGVGEKITAPVKSLWDQLLKIVGTLLSAQITMWAIDNPEIFRGTIQTLRGIVNAISNTIVWTVGIVGGIAEFGYKIADTAKEWTYAALGEDGAAKLKEIEPAIMGFLNVLVGIGAGIAALNLLRPKAKGHIRGGSGRRFKRGTRTQGIGDVKGKGKGNWFTDLFKKNKVSQGGQSKGFRLPWQKSNVPTQGVGGAPKSGNWFTDLFKRNKVTQGVGGKSQGFRLPWISKVTKGIGGKAPGVLSMLSKIPGLGVLRGVFGRVVGPLLFFADYWNRTENKGQSEGQALAGAGAGQLGFWGGSSLAATKFLPLLAAPFPGARPLYAIGVFGAGLLSAMMGTAVTDALTGANKVDKNKIDKKVLSKKIQKKGDMWWVAQQKIRPRNILTSTYSQEEYDKLQADYKKKATSGKAKILNTYQRRLAAQNKKEFGGTGYAFTTEINGVEKTFQPSDEGYLEAINAAEALKDSTSNQPKDVSLVPLPVTDGSSGGTSQPSTVAVAPVSGSNVNNSYGPLLHANFYKS